MSVRGAVINFCFLFPSRFRYTLMKLCMNFDAEKRPSFAMCLQRLEQLAAQSRLSQPPITCVHNQGYSKNYLLTRKFRSYLTLVISAFRFLMSHRLRSAVNLCACCCSVSCVIVFQETPVSIYCTLCLLYPPHVIVSFNLKALCHIPDPESCFLSLCIIVRITMSAHRIRERI